MTKTLEKLLQEMNDTELMHYGRKGMRWYQHIFGKEPSGASSQKQVMYTEGLRKRGTKKEQSSTAKRISNKDLSSIIKRLEMENKYVNLTVKDTALNKLLKWIKNRGSMVINTSLTEIQKAYIKEMIKNKKTSTKGK